MIELKIKSVENLYKKYNGKVLADDGCYVSKEYKNFQNAFNRTAKAIADNINAELTSTSKGHYDGSMFFKRGGNFVYVHYGNSTNRTTIDFDGRNICVRTAKSDRDFVGGLNNFVTLKQLAHAIDLLLD